MFINIILYVRDQVIPQGKQTWQGLIKMHLTTIKDRALETICWTQGLLLQKAQLSQLTNHESSLAGQQRELPASSGRFPRRVCQGGHRGSCHQRIVSQFSPLSELSESADLEFAVLPLSFFNSKKRNVMKHSAIKHIPLFSPISSPLFFLQSFNLKVKKLLLHMFLFYHFRSGKTF